MVDGQHRERVGDGFCCVNRVGEREVMDQVGGVRMGWGGEGKGAKA